MAKAARRKKKTVAFYLRVYSKKSSAYFISFFVGLMVYTAGTYLFKPQPPCANSLTCKSDLSLAIDNNAVGFFQGHKVIPPIIDTANDAKSSVLGAKAPNAEKHVYVDLSTQKLYAYQGDAKILETWISSGKWGRTPTGNFNIWEKLRATRMAGGSGDDAYNLPNVPYVMYFYNDFGLHGAYWHDNFGHTMSHGCVNMRQVDAHALYDWVDGPGNGKKGTAVSVCDSFAAPNKCVQKNPIN